MNRHKESDLRRELRQRGYSAAYAQRLIDELSDHWMCIDEEDSNSATPAKPQECEARLGQNAQILDVLVSIPVLEPMPRRFPLTTFGMVPAVLLLAAQLLAVLIANNLTQTRPFQSDIWNGVLSSSLQWASFGFPLAIAFLASWVAIRYRSSWDMLLIATVIAAFGCFYTIRSEFCSDTKQIICYQTWSIEYCQLILVLAPALLCCFARLNGRQAYCTSVSQ